MIVLPTESFLDYVEHPLVKRLYLTDVGFFPRAEHHFRERKDGIEEYIYTSPAQRSSSAMAALPSPTQA